MVNVSLSLLLNEKCQHFYKLKWKMFAFRMFNFQVEQFAHHHKPEGTCKLFFSLTTTAAANDTVSCCCCLTLLLLPYPIRCFSTFKFTLLLLLLYGSVKTVARADMHGRVFIRAHSSKRLFHEQDNIHKIVYVVFKLIVSTTVLSSPASQPVIIYIHSFSPIPFF